MKPTETILRQEHGPEKARGNYNMFLTIVRTTLSYLNINGRALQIRPKKLDSKYINS